MEFIKDDTRIIVIQPNPYKDRVSNRTRMRQVKIGRNGLAILNQDGSRSTQEIKPENMILAPGTFKTFTPKRLANNRLATGLDIMVPNPYARNDSFKTSWAEKVLKNQPEVLLQHLLEYEHGVDFDYYTSAIEDKIFKSGEAKFYYQKSESKPRLGNGVTMLNMANPNHRLWYYAIRQMNEVAGSLAELQDKTDANWYIVDEEEKEIVRMSEIDRIVKAASAFKMLEDHKDSTMMTKISKCLDISEANDKSLTLDKAKRLVYDYYNRGQFEYDNFIKFADLANDKVRGVKFVDAHALLFDLLRYKIVDYRGNKYTWYNRNEEGTPTEQMTRHNKDSMIAEFILDPAWDEQVKRLKNDLSNKMK